MNNQFNSAFSVPSPTFVFKAIQKHMLMNPRLRMSSAVVYSELFYRMLLSVKHPDRFFNRSFFVIYKVRDLAHDNGLSIHTVTNALQQLAGVGLIKRIRHPYFIEIHLPKFKRELSRIFRRKRRKPSANKVSRRRSVSVHRGSKSFQPRPAKNELLKTKSNTKNKDNVCIHTHGRAGENKLNFKRLCKIYEPKLVHYAVKITKKSAKIIYNKFNFVVGILEKWQRKGIKNLTAAIAYETGHYRHNRCGRHGFSSQSPQARQVIEELPDWGRKGYHYDPKKDVASPRIIRESKIIMKKLRREKAEEG